MCSSWTGRKEYVQDTLYLFADGAFLVEYEQVGKDYVFSDRVWETVYEQVKEYFSGGEIVGWLLYDDDLTEERLLKAQKKNFPSEDMLLIKTGGLRGGLYLLIFIAGGSLRTSRPGAYFVYYEEKRGHARMFLAGMHYQNAARAAEEEQAIRKKEEPVVNFRKRMQKNREPRKQAGGTHGILCGGFLFAAAGSPLTGITMAQNHDRMQQLETAADLAGTPQAGGDARTDVRGGSPTAETAPKKMGRAEQKGLPGRQGYRLVTPTLRIRKAQPGMGTGQSGSAGQADGTGSQGRVEEAPAGVTPLTDTASTGSSVENGSGQNSQGQAADGAASSGAESESSQNSGEIGMENENREAGQDDGSAGAQSDSETSDQDADATGGQTQDETAPASTNVPVQYTVQPGDTLLAISKRVYGTDQMVGKICAANGINDGDKILAGQKILLP